MLYYGETVRDALHAAIKGTKPNRKPPANRSSQGKPDKWNPQKTISRPVSPPLSQPVDAYPRAECERINNMMQDVITDMNNLERHYLELVRQFNRVKDRRLLVHLQMIGVSVAGITAARSVPFAIRGITRGIGSILARRGAVENRHAFGLVGGLSAGGAFFASLDNLDDIIESLSLPNLWRRQGELNDELRALAEPARALHSLWQSRRRNWRRIAQQYENSGCEVYRFDSIRRAD